MPCVWRRCGARVIGPATGTSCFKCHNTRNLGEYEGLMDVDERLVADLIAAAQAVVDATRS
jgi:hypothetical protein